MISLSVERAQRAVRLAAYATVALTCCYGVWLGRPDLAFLPGAPYRTDLGGHILALRNLVQVSLPAGHLLDWSHQWFAGYPSFYFYFPLPALLIAALSLVAPLEVAAKLFAVLAPGLLPATVYMVVRATGFGRGHAALAVVGTGAFLSLTSYSIYGGNVIGSVIGEYSYALSLALALLYLAAVAQCAQGKRRVPHMALLLCATALAHVIPTLFAVIASCTALTRRNVWRQVVAAWVLAFGLSAFWSVPFVLRSPYMGSIQWEQHFDLFLLLPVPLLTVAPWVVAAGRALRRSGWRPGLLAAITAAGGASYFLPHGLFAQPRGLPIFHLGMYLLAGLGIGAGLQQAYRAQRRAQLAAWVGGLVVLVAVAILQMETVRDRSARLLASGAPDSASYEALARKLASLPAGRVHWEFRSGEMRTLGGPLTLAHLTSFGAGIRTTFGPNAESSVTWPAYVYLLQNLSRDALDTAIWRFPAPNDTSTERTLTRLRQLGVTYHVTFSTEAHAWAAGQPHALHRVATHPDWIIWRVARTTLVEPVERVRSARGTARHELVRWLTGITDTSTWVLSGDHGRSADFGQGFVAGPDRVVVSDVRLTHRRVRFETTAIGIPHVVRVGYFPNWRAYGADGPWQVVPGFMLVVPRQRLVTLQFETTWVEWAGLILSLIAVLLLAGLAVNKSRPGREPPDGS